MKKWYRAVPIISFTEQVSAFRKAQDAAWAISQVFVMDNNIHYTMTENQWNMRLTDEEAMLLTLKLPSELSLRQLPNGY